MTELRGLQLRLDEFQRLGVRIVAVSPDPIEKNRGVVDRLELDFPILSDDGLELTRALGLEHPGAGPGGAEVPRPATLIVRDGTIRWRDLTDNWRIRPRPDDVLAALASVGVSNR